MTQMLLPKMNARKRRSPVIKGRKLKAGERSLRYLRKLGYTAEVCEQFRARVEGKKQRQIFQGGYHKDLFGFMDILAYNDQETIAVQTTSRNQIAAHVRKYRSDEETAERIQEWLCGQPNRRFVIHGWECVEVPNKRGAGSHARWQVTEREVTAEDLVEPEF
jgi:hypothetical protein